MQENTNKIDLTGFITVHFGEDFIELRGIDKKLLAEVIAKGGTAEVDGWRLFRNEWILQPIEIQLSDLLEYEWLSCLN